jgi:trigger factor
MMVTETLSEGLKRAYTVVVPASDIEGKRTAKLTQIGKTLRLPGFRPGKVPMPLVRQRYGTAVMAEVVEESVNEATRQVLSDRGLRPAMQPKVDLVSAETSQAASKDLEFKVELELLPEITLPDFAALSLVRLKVDVTPEMIDRLLSDIAGRQRTFEDIEEIRPAVEGDTLQIDFLGKIDGTPFPGGSAEDVDAQVGGAGFITGFTEQLVGLSPGESRTIDVTFPEDYQTKDLAGKAAQFDITAKKLRREVVPAVDDALATKLGFEDLEKLRDAAAAQMRRDYDQQARLRLKRQLLDALAGAVSYSVPEAMVASEFAQIWSRLEADRSQGKLDPEDREKDEETLRTEYRSIAERRVRLGLLLAEIGRVHTITVGTDELSRAMRMEAGRYQGQEAQVLEFFRKTPAAVESLRAPIFEDKVVDFVIELAQVEERLVSPEELAREVDAA